VLKHHPIRRALTGGVMIAAVSVPSSAWAGTVDGPPVCQGACQRDGHMYATRSRAPSLASVLRSLPPRERRYVLGLASLSLVQLWGAFGTSPTPPVRSTRTR
jgi:hypothetical protein